MFPAVFNLANLNGINGFSVYSGGSVNNFAINSQSFGDFNGDGISDFCFVNELHIIGGPAYIIFGSATFDPEVYLSSLNGFNGFGIVSSSFGGSLLYCSIIGDINNDQFSELSVSDSTTTYIIYGTNQLFPAIYNVTQMSPSSGFTITSNTTLASPAGDLNNDTISDVLFATESMNAYVLFGVKGNFPQSISFSQLNGANGFGIYNNQLAASCTFVVSGGTTGDVNSDGIWDLLLVNYNVGHGIGGNEFCSADIIFGHNSFEQTLNISSLDGTNGFIVELVPSAPTPRHTLLGLTKSNSSSENNGYTSRYDVNCDGIDDVLIGAPEVDSFTGVANIIFGNNSFPNVVYLSELNGNNGFKIVGGAINNAFGTYNGILGDFNGDTCSDIVASTGYIFSNPNVIVNFASVIFGNNTFPEYINSVSLSGKNGFNTDFDPGVELFALLVSGVAGIGDVNGDGLMDAYISLFTSDTTAPGIFILFGSGKFPSPSPIPSATPSVTASITPSHWDSEMSSGEIAGIAVGAVVGVALLGAAMFWYGKTHGWCAGDHHVEYGALN
jgi:hypothetical protein